MPKYIKTIAPVDSMSGKFGARKDNVCGKTIIANVRKAKSNTNEGRPYMYFSVLTKTTAGNSANQLAWRTKFGQICVATRNRLYDPAHISQDQAAFKQQTQYKTMYSFVWNLVEQSMQ